MYVLHQRTDFQPPPSSMTPAALETGRPAA